MQKFLQKIIQKYLEEKTFKDFFILTLTPVEEEIARSAISKKYSVTILSAFLWSLLGLPAIIYLDTTIIGVVLTPIAMVAGSAWFMISLSTMKAKFSDFGMILTTHMLEAFIISLFLMLYMAIYALNVTAFSFAHQLTAQQLAWVNAVAGVLGALSIMRIVYLIIIGSMKYDMNDAMLTGQNEAAQEFFTKSLNFSYQVTDLIRKEPNVETTNYYISDAFSRIFNSARDLITNRKNENYQDKVKIVETLNEKALSVLKNPAMEQAKIYAIFLELLIGFKNLLNQKNRAARKIGYVEIEIECLRSEKNDSPRTKALRYATIFTLIHEIISDEGEDIFL